MLAVIGTHTEPESKPLHLLRPDDLDRWRDGLPRPAANWVRNTGFTAEPHRLLLLPDESGGIAGAVVGAATEQADGSFGLWTLAGLPEKLPRGHWHIANPLAAAEATRVLLGWALSSYRFDRYRAIPRQSERSVVLAAPAGADLSFVQRTSEADSLARDLINTPAGDMGVVQLATVAARLATRYGARFDQTVGQALIEGGLHAIHAVGRAGPEAPRLLDISWGKPGDPKVTLVGKGVCFDSGGLNIKNPQGMGLMKKDMGGAACALALAQMVMDAGLPVRLRVLIPAVENSIDALSYRPGDILVTRKGITVEVNNTDAEGRLVLADALTLADEESPDLLIDMATLTGAARVALGPDLPALFVNDEPLAAEALAASTASSDPVWRLPLWSGYDEDLSSKVADLSNVSSSGFSGAILGALFLRRFVSQATRWIHVDMYGWNPRERPGRPVGAVSSPLRALYELLRGRYGGGRA